MVIVFFNKKNKISVNGSKINHRKKTRSWGGTYGVIQFKSTEEFEKN